ncbi:iron-containing redox enzyme family protein [Colwellia sp. D2M02]|uniref:iron-containing redox enzyme family protein n=1 Tax=Colwellia sp. D2M02 TaxID=2841562 RepID=UPI001C083C96|nr:iron-containing redox enzyme family protein [Colwellia sp. D2M02]MBU2892017.1 iron-containing redox enzyme family protein [Colwellia sp. D2M02]
MDNIVLTKLGQSCLQSLLKVWFDFDLAITQVPIIKRLEQGRLSIEDYQSLLLNLRQQVIEGSRWISRCASSFDREYADVRSTVISHATEEHRDYLILENDYVATGGTLTDIQAASKNIGSEALHGFLMYRASQPNPVDLIGAMWIIEGLGNKMASKWSQRINEQFSFENTITAFMDYHGENDENHLQALYRLIDRVATSPERVNDIIRTAKVVAKLYQLQLEEVDNG